MTTATHDKQAEDTTRTTSKKPAKVFRHRNISASIFENIAKNGGTFHSVVLHRTYKDGEEFKHTSSFTRDEIPVALHLLEKAWAFILEAEAK